ncbi:WbqC family protein [Patescibacteria group bacterium AH-259-L07]|nr:WbqC family protein [Patescibacteria group bacterium AH-259-L07]
MITTIHQPEHLPWLGLIDKIFQSQIFVILDTVQFKKNNFQNRNKIRTRDDWTWLTIPIKKHSLNTKIIDIEISYNRDWMESYLNLLKINYKEAEYFTTYYPPIEQLILQKYEKLADLNFEIIKLILKSFDIKTKIVKSSNLTLDKDVRSSQLLLEICKALSVDTYLSGAGGKTYLDLTIFKSAGIEVKFQEFYHPIYIQLYEPFIPAMSCLDLLFLYGSKAKNILQGKDTK